MVTGDRYGNEDGYDQGYNDDDNDEDPMDVLRRRRRQENMDNLNRQNDVPVNESNADDTAANDEVWSGVVSVEQNEQKSSEIRRRRRLRENQMVI
jgi:cytochrome c556